MDAEALTPHIVRAFANAQAPGAPAALAALAADARVARAVALLRTWDFSTPTGIREGWDPGDDPDALPAPSAQEVSSSIAATIYSVWRGQVVQRVLDDTLSGIGLGDFAPTGDVALADLRQLLETFPARRGRGASGINFFNVAGAGTPEEARDRILLGSLSDALTLLASDAFAPAFDHSTNQNDYRWGKLHRIVFDHPLGGPFNIPPSGGLFDLEPDLRGVARSGGFGSVDAASHNVRADGVNEFMFGSGPARRFVGTLQRSGPAAEEVIPGGTSGVIGSPFQADQLRLWLTNHYHPWIYRPDEVLGDASSVEGLEPVH